MKTMFGRGASGPDRAAAGTAARAIKTARRAGKYSNRIGCGRVPGARRRVGPLRAWTSLRLLLFAFLLRLLPRRRGIHLVRVSGDLELDGLRLAVELGGHFRHQLLLRGVRD